MTTLAIIGGVLLAFVLLVGALVWSARQRGRQSQEIAASSKAAEIKDAELVASVRADPDVERVLRSGGF